MKRNYVMAPRNPFINCSEVKGAFCGDNGQCVSFKCQEWIDGVACYPELVREDRDGFAICPRCGGSYGASAMTGEEYRRATSEGQDRS